MKKLNLVFLFVFGLIFSSYSFAASVTTWVAGASGTESFGSSTSETGTIAIGDYLKSADYSLAIGASTSFYFTTLEELNMVLSTSTTNALDSWSTSLSHVGTTHTWDRFSTGDHLDTLQTSNFLSIGSYIYTIANLSTTRELAFNVSTAIASTPIPAALLLFGTAFAGLFGVKSYNSKKMAA